MRQHSLVELTFLLIIGAALGACGSGGNNSAPPAPPAAVATASFTAPATVAADVPVVFDASASTSSDGSNLQYFWDFGDGQQGGGREIARLFGSGGARSVRLTVIDGAGLTASRTQTITVAARPAPGSSGSVEGAVTDIAGVVVDGVSVAVVGGAAVGTTDAMGKVQFTLGFGVPVTLKLVKNGFADQLVALQMPATAGADAYFAATMRTREAALSLADAAAGGSLTGRDGAVITLPANALVDAGGGAVTGAVSIAMTPVDVTQANAGGFPGAFDGLPPDGTMTPILSYGTVEFILTKGAQRLQLAPGKTATIEIPLYATVNVDGSELAVGDTTPLWSLDELTGVWIQEGQGTVVTSAASPTGLALRAVVAHLSWWNADIGFDPYGPQPKCVYDTDSGVPGGNDTFATATVCNMLAEFDRDPAPAPLIAGRAQQTAQALSPRIVGYSRSAVLPVGGGVTIPVPANVNIVLTAGALNGTWTGRRIVNGAVGVQAEEVVLMRPIAGSGPGTEAITVPFDGTRGLQAGQTALFGFTGTALRYARVTVSQGVSSLLTGQVRLLRAAAVLGTATFSGIPGQITALLPADGQYLVEVTGLTNAPGAYRLRVELIGGIETETLSVPFSVNKNLPAFFSYRGEFTTAPLTLMLAYSPFGSGTAGTRLVAPDGSVLLSLPVPGYQGTELGTATLPVTGTYTLEAGSSAGSAFNVRVAAESTSWVGAAPPLPSGNSFSLIDLVADRNGKPVIGHTRTFVNAGHDSAMLMLRRWTGTTWETVGTDVTIDRPCNSGFNAIDFGFDATNAPVIAYGNSSPILGNSSTYISAQRFSGGVWQPLGPNDGRLPNGSTFGGACNNPPALAFNAADQPLLAYRVDNDVVVQRFDGAAWTDVTTSGADSFAAQSYSFDLSADANGRIYFVLASPAFSGGATRVRRLTTATPPVWEAVGQNNGALPEIGTLGLGNSTPRLRFDAANSPLIAFIACVGSAGTCSSGVAVYRFDGAQWSTTGGYHPTPLSYISNGNDLGFTQYRGETFISWVDTTNGVNAPIVQTNSAAGYTPVGNDLGQVPQLWTHGLISNTGYSMRLLATGGELYLASAVFVGAEAQIYLLRKVD